ncbi:HAD-IB family phosphatase [Luteolibacter luteus]|nr:HAD-IB family phosphatase [Luteolibacter luteus]
MKNRRLEVSVDDQMLRLYDGADLIREWPVSTAAKGVGFTSGSLRTPTGRFVIVQKIGEGQPSGTIFVAREPVGLWQPGEESGTDHVLTRIIRISGLEPENANTFDRYIYFHGTDQEDKLGTPASWGCIRLSNEHIIELHDLVEPGMTAEILPPTRKHGKVIFFDCDSTLSTIEGIDELGRARGPEIFKMVEHLTNQAMNGEVPINEVFGRRMEIIRPDRATAEAVARLYIDTMVPGVAAVIEKLKADGWTPVILSGGFAPLIHPLAKELGIDHVEAVPVYFDDDGGYAGYGVDYPTTRNGGKPEVIREWKKAMLPEVVVMMGDGVSDLEAKGEVDLFIGFGGVVAREAVRLGADAWLTDMADFGNVVLPDGTRYATQGH